MKSVFLRYAAITLCLCMLLPLFSHTAKAEIQEASDIRSSTTITGSGYNSFSFLFDNNTTSYTKSAGNTVINLKNDAGIGSIYLLLHKAYGSYTIIDNSTGATITAGEQGFLHEYVDLAHLFGYAPKSVTIDFANGAVQLSEIYVFSEGTPPDFVQIWQPPLEGKADLVLFATHGDDDQLFFAGLLPLYAGELGLNVQVVYLTNHRSGYVDNARMHEMINGLWAVGVTAYPVWGNFADFRIDSLQGTYNAYANSYNTTKDDLLRFVVEQIRRFKPLVAVGHDLKGEYGHGMHMVYADLLVQALELTKDPTAYPASADAYGTWEIQKLYLHLYQENQIVMDYDQPLSAFDGMTAFQVTQKLGFPCHKSQQWTWFKDWLNGGSAPITSATQISTYNPCYFGLYYTTVGPDVQKNDFMENIVTYGQQEKNDREAASAVTNMIASLQVTLESGPQISAARDAYNALTDTQKALVTNFHQLVETEAAYAALVQAKQEQDAADKAAAQAVEQMIASLNVTLDSGDALTAARNAYNSLTDSQKALVTNHPALVEAEAAYADLIAQEENRLQQEADSKRVISVRGVTHGVLFVLLILALAVLCMRIKQRRK